MVDSTGVRQAARRSRLARTSICQQWAAAAPASSNSAPALSVLEDGASAPGSALRRFGFRLARAATAARLGRLVVRGLGHRFARRHGVKLVVGTTGFTPDDKPYGKLVVGPRTEVFNLREDPYETRNVATDRPKKTTHLTNALNAWLKRTGAKLPTQNPDFNEKRWWISAKAK